MTFVYRYYDQAELERQLNARATVPDITPILARYASESARMRARLSCRLAVSYWRERGGAARHFSRGDQGTSADFCVSSRRLLALTRQRRFLLHGRMLHQGGRVRGSGELRACPARHARRNRSPMRRGDRLGTRARARFRRRSYAYSCKRQLRWRTSCGDDARPWLAR